jgi:hypothetical protein
MTRDEAFQLARKHDSRVSAKPVPIIPSYMVEPETIRDHLSGAHLFEIDHGGSYIGGNEYVGVTDPEGKIIAFVVGE